MRRGILSGVALVLACIGCSRASKTRAPSGAATEDTTTPASEFVVPDDARGLTTGKAERVSVPDWLEIAATIQPDPTRVVRVYAPLSGRLISVGVRPSDEVHAGQVLATLASSDVAGARAAFRQAEADAEVKQRDVERARQLWRNDAIAQRDVQQAEADARMSAAALQSARERLQFLGVDTVGVSDELAVTAPRSGVIIDVAAAAGQFSKSLDNSDPLCTIADLSTVWAVGDVFEKDLAGIKVGEDAEVSLAAYPGETLRGRIAAVGSNVDTATRTLKVRVVLANPGRRLKPDMFASVRVVRAVRAAIVVPLAAVVREGTSAFVFVQRSPGHFERRTVTLGRDTDQRGVEVTSGLAPGETVVLDGAELLRAATTAS